VIVVDLRFDGVDFATDAFGWALALHGLVALSRLHVGFRVAGAAAACGLVAWAADPWLGVDRDLASSVEGVAQTVIVFATCTALMTLVPDRRRTADLIRWWDLGLGLAVLAIGFLMEGQSGSDAAFLVLLLIVPVFVVYIAFLVLLFRCAPLTPRAATASR
jgi:hypothetical protein